MNGSPSSSPSTSSAPSTSEAKICLVCGAENASRHYGAITCGRCKVFFIRAVTVDKDYKCHAAGKCTYPESKCRSCRYNRCIEVGMIPETVARREGCTRQLKRFSKPKLDEEDRQEAQLPQFDEEIDVETPMEIDFVAFQRELKNEALNAQKPPSPPTFEEDDDLCDQQPSTSRGLCSHSPDPLQALVDQFELPNNNLSIVPSLTWAMKTFGANMSLWIPKDSTDVGGQLVALDKVCSKDNSDTSSITPFSIALNMSIADLLDNPEIIAPRGPLGFSETAPVTTDRTQLTHMVFARKLIYYIDWLRGTKEFWMLGDSDRNRLCCQQYNPMTCLTMFYNTYVQKSDGVLYGLGAIGKRNETPMDNEYIIFNNFMVDYVQKHIVSAMREAELTYEEYVIFRNVFLFNTNLSLSEAGTKIVKAANLRYSNELLELIKKNAKPTDPPGALEKRITTIFGLQSHVLLVAYRSSRFFGRAAALNVSGMRGQLTHDIFFNPDCP